MVSFYIHFVILKAAKLSKNDVIIQVSQNSTKSVISTSYFVQFS